MCCPRSASEWAQERHLAVFGGVWAENIESALSNPLRCFKGMPPPGAAPWSPRTGGKHGPEALCRAWNWWSCSWGLDGPFARITSFAPPPWRWSPNRSTQLQRPSRAE